MTVIRPNSISGVTSITAQTNALNFYDSAGATLSIGANVTGSATGLTGTPNITVGSISASSATISGSVSVAGTVTYEDVTNVDSVGLITARSGIQVSSGSSIVVGSSFVKDNAIGIGSTNTTGRNAGIGTLPGTIIYNSTSSTIEFYDGTSWNELSLNLGLIETTDFFGDGSGYGLYLLNGNASSVTGVRNGTNTNVTFEDTSRITAKLKQYGVFNGSSAYITLFTKPAGSFSSSCWFKTTTSGYIFGDVGGAYNITWTLYVNGSGYLTLVVDGPGGPTYNLTSSNTVHDGNWHHAVVTKSGSTHTIFIDGVQRATGTSADRAGVNNILLGTYSTGSGFFNGNIDQVRFFTKTLSGSEVTSLYNYEKP